MIVNCNTEGGGRSGGLAMIWHNDVNLHIIDHNKMLIDFMFWIVLVILSGMVLVSMVIHTNPKNT